MTCFFFVCFLEIYLLLILSFHCAYLFRIHQITLFIFVDRIPDPPGGSSENPDGWKEKPSKARLPYYSRK